MNGDGKVDVADLVELINYRRGQASEHFNLEAADANHDGTVDDKDIEALAGQLVNGEDADFEMVVEMRDGTVYTIPITKDYPILRYESIYMGDDLHQNVLNIATSSEQAFVRCQDVKRILTRESSGNTILPPSSVSEDKTDPYDGQHVSIKLATGDSLQYNLSAAGVGFRPVKREGNVVWSFLTGEIKNDDWVTEEQFCLDNVECIDFRSFEYDEVEVRKALIEFYQAMNGDNWDRNDNWCSDKPIWEWYGINGCLDKEGNKFPWVEELWFNCAPINGATSGTLPECISRMGPMRNFALPVGNIEGEFPAFLNSIYSLEVIVLSGNHISGQFPEGLDKLPNLQTFFFEGNDVEGPLPESFILSFMNNSKKFGNNFNLKDNKFSGKVPQSIQQHPRFKEYWPGIVIQKTPLDISDLVLPAPTFSFKDINGSVIDLAETYRKNKYTLLYKWGIWCPFSEAFNQVLIPVCKAYKDKGLEVIGLHYDLNLDDGLLDYLKEHDIPWNNAIGKNWNYNPDTSSKYETAIFEWGGTPRVFLVDQEGNIVFNDLIDGEGNYTGGCNRNDLLPFLEKKLGPIDYNYYTSEDYSHDGEVVTLQKATKGNGFDLVFVGEGFTDRDIKSGRFDQRMNEALEQFFAYEPYTSLRDRFNVYGVKTVSPNAEFATGCVHAIDVDYEKAFEYASKVTDLIPNRPMRVTVVYNNASGGRSFCMMLEDDSYICFAMDGNVSDVLNHESGGHGIGKLFDEYVEDANEGLTLPEEAKTELDTQWTTLGWGANVDWRSDPKEVKWAKFINDSRYVGEKIGVYEGSYLYRFGAYRPTENSMMRYNDMPFNAPSREEIYKRVMQESEGDSWTYDYETFVAFDAAGRQQFVDALTNASRASSRGDRPGGSKAQRQIKTRPPVFLKGTWRDALKRK